MGRFALSFRAWWRILRDQEFAAKVSEVLDRAARPLPSPAPPTAAAAEASRPARAAVSSQRSDAINLLAVLQRESRLVDFLKEEIAPYSNDQIGAAVRDVHRDAAKALDRIFALRPVSDQPEGASITVPTAFDAGRFRLIGHVTGAPPYRGALRHGGWEATCVELPQWTGSDASARVVAPAEVEVVHDR